ncbi:MAG: LGFP repeat-containing protein [Dietzia sp.]
MNRITRALAAVTVAAAATAGLSACSSDGESDQDGATGSSPTTSEVMTTTSSAPVPGPDDSTVEIPAPVADRWNDLGGETGELGRATGPATDVEDGSVTQFERGAIVLTPAGRAFVVQGAILTAYQEEGGPEGQLGFPTADEATTDGGWISTFEGGVITYLDGVAEVRVD